MEKQLQELIELQNEYLEMGDEAAAEELVFFIDELSQLIDEDI
ncbi:MAG: hypothetical protein VW518_05845 [Burkholderiaceae bacterium]